MMSARREYEFTCPACGATMQVNEPMRTAIIEDGCVLCGTTVAASAFRAH